jgi:hypothetical protein
VLTIIEVRRDTCGTAPDMQVTSSEELHLMSMSEGRRVISPVLMAC